MTTIYSVSAASILRLAEQIERDAGALLFMWVALKQADRYASAMASSRALRSAAAERDMHIRRAMLRNAGFIIKRPAAARSITSAASCPT